MSLYLVNPLPYLFHPGDPLVTVLVVAFWAAVVWAIAAPVWARLKRKKEATK